MKSVRRLNAFLAAQSCLVLLVLCKEFHAVSSTVILPLNAVLITDFDESDNVLNNLVDGNTLDAGTPDFLIQKEKRSLDSDSIESRSKDIVPFLSRNLGGNFGVGIGAGGGVLAGNCFCCRAFVCRRQSCPCSKFVF